jgi:hypothetical protein
MGGTGCALECRLCRARQAQGCRISRVTIFEIDAGVRAVLSEIETMLSNTMKTSRSRHTPHLNGWVRGRTLNDPLTNFFALC